MCFNKCKTCHERISGTWQYWTIHYSTVAHQVTVSKSCQINQVVWICYIFAEHLKYASPRTAPLLALLAFLFMDYCQTIVNVVCFVLPVKIKLANVQAFSISKVLEFCLTWLNSLTPLKANHIVDLCILYVHEIKLQTHQILCFFSLSFFAMPFSAGKMGPECHPYFV